MSNLSLLVLIFFIVSSIQGFTLYSSKRKTAICQSHLDALSDDDSLSDNDGIPMEVDVAIVGAGLGGLCAGAILNTLYKKQVAIFESHYLPGGCAHAFNRTAQNGETFTFDSGPTILLGCSEKPFSALRQVLEAVGQSVDWIRYDGWGMIENPTRENEVRWKCELGPDLFQQGPLEEFGGSDSVKEFEALRTACRGLIVGANIPAMAMRPGKTALFPLLRYFPTLVELIQQGPELTGTFEPYMDGPKFVVKNKWLRNWLDALAFSLSGLPASRTSAAAMAFVLEDMHRDGAALDYPRGGLGAVVDALVKGLEHREQRSKLFLRQTVASIDFDEDGTKVSGITLKNGKTIKTRNGVICNAPVWTLRNLVHNDNAIQKLDGILPENRPIKVQHPKQTWKDTADGPVISLQRELAGKENDAKGLLSKCDTAEMTGSFLHLHIAINSTGLDLDKMEAHYTVMDRGLGGDPSKNRVDYSDGPCGELNMVAVSNPCVIDQDLAPEGFMILHAYGAGNEPYYLWEGLARSSSEYKRLKDERTEVLWRAIESVIPDVRSRIVMDLSGSPLTHERFLRRPRGTYGAATEDYLADGSTPISGFVLAGDSIFPGIGIPSVAISGASAANGLISPFAHWACLEHLR